MKYVSLLLVLVVAGCSSVTDFDRFHPADDGGSATDAAHMDAPGTDAGPCEEPVAESCNGEDDDCDGMTDEGFDLDTDPDNCGTCGRSCPDVPNSAPACAAGECTPSCDEGWGDCDDDYISGCETDLTSPDDCVTCGTVCDSGTFCSSSGCVSDCPGSEEVCGRTCVDTQTDTSHCGSCDSACTAPPHASATCASGSCGFICDAEFENCNSSARDGCETDIRTTSDCGGCGITCMVANGSPVCSSSTCRIGSCDTGYDDCDGVYSNGCEELLVTYYEDLDGDRYGNPTTGTQYCAESVPSGWVVKSGDCDDHNDAVRPGAAETCNHVDDDCDERIDENADCTGNNRAHALSMGDPGSAGTFRRRTSASPWSTVPSDVTVGVDELGDMTSMVAGPERHALGFVRSRDVYLRVIDCYVP